MPRQTSHRVCMDAQTLQTQPLSRSPDPESVSIHSAGIGVWLQRLCGRLALFPLGFVIIGLIRLKFRYSVSNLAELRREFKAISASGRPLVLCPNHLTMVDSVILLWALASLPTYFLNFKLFAWNIPAIENYAHRPLWRLVTYLTKCIPIDRHGGNEHVASVFKKLAALLRSGDLCMVFPEGTRSRTGRIQVETPGYGIGKILKEVPGCEVVCVYLRGKGQVTYSDFPMKGESFYIKLEKITPASQGDGLRAVRDNSMQIITKLKEMEDAYFVCHGP